MPHDHDHADAAPHVSFRKMGWAVGLTIASVIGEGIAGWLSNSIALLSDAVHNFADAARAGVYLVGDVDRRKTRSRSRGTIAMRCTARSRRWQEAMLGITIDVGET